MDPKPGQIIKLIFRNGLVEEGIVQSWSNERTVLQSQTSKNKLIILKTSEDIIAVKIIEKENTQPIKPEYTNSEFKLKNTIYEEPDLNIKEPILNNKDRVKKLVELKQEAKKMEAEKLRKHFSTFENHGSTYDVTYGIPRKLQKPPKRNTSEKN